MEKEANRFETPAFTINKCINTCTKEKPKRKEAKMRLKVEFYIDIDTNKQNQSTVC